MRAMICVGCVCLLVAAGCGSDQQTSGLPGGGSAGGGSPGAGGTTAGTGGAAGGAGATGGPGAVGGPGVAGGAGVAGGIGGAGGSCEQHVVDGTLATPDMLIVLDRSGSMNPDSNDDDADRWGGSREAVIDVTSRFDDRIRFGLMTFPGNSGSGDRDDDEEDECAPGMLDIAIGAGTGDAIASTLQAMDADGRTPTAPTLDGALAVLGAQSAVPDEVVGAKYVLLVTDGDPNCSGGGGGRGGDRDDEARQQTIAAIEALTAAGVKTYVVGYQTAGTDFADQLDRMAAAGGTGATTHQSVESGADLSATMAEIAGRLVSCSYRLDAPVSNPTMVLVTVGGRQRNLGQTDDGWTLGPDSQTVTLTGVACEDVQSGMPFVVTVTCSTVPPV